MDGRAKNLVIAEATARELGALDLSEALDLVCLVAEASPDRLDAFARRWLARLADERPLPLAELDTRDHGATRAPLCASCRRSPRTPLTRNGQTLAKTHELLRKEALDSAYLLMGRTEHCANRDDREILTLPGIPIAV